MVRIEYFGAWNEESKQAVRKIIADCVEKNMKISVLPAYFEEESLDTGATGHDVSENYARGENESAAVSVCAASAAYFKSGTDSDAKVMIAPKPRCESGANIVNIKILIYPAGNGRTRRLTAREIVKNIALQTGSDEKNIFVTIDAPPQERRSYAEER